MVVSQKFCILNIDCDILCSEWNAMLEFRPLYVVNLKLADRDNEMYCVTVDMIYPVMVHWLNSTNNINISWWSALKMRRDLDDII